MDSFISSKKDINNSFQRDKGTVSPCGSDTTDPLRPERFPLDVVCSRTDTVDASGLKPPNSVAKVFVSFFLLLFLYSNYFPFF